MKIVKALVIIICTLFIVLINFASIPPEAGGKTLPSMSSMLKNVMPAVVNITVLGQLPPVPVTLKLPGIGQQKKIITPKFQSVGSGVIIDAKKGYIVTNAHVIKDAKLITVTLSNGIRLKAKKIGVDKLSDIAVLQVKSKHLAALPFANSDILKVGDFVAAIGNPFGLHQTVTSGVISALHRSNLGIEGPKGYENFIQTDAPINPGNSGGALVNLKGKLVGINTAIIAPDRGNVGIGFSIPSNMVKRIMEQLIKYGKIKRGIIGVMVQNLTPELADGFNISGITGALVTHILPGSPAAKAGLKSEDVIEKVDNVEISNAAQLRNITGLLPIGSTIKLSIRRKNRLRNFSMKISDPKKIEMAGISKVPTLLAGVKLEDIDLLDPTMGHVQGLAVLYVDQTSEAWLGGLRPGDVILSVNGKSVNDIDTMTKIAAASTKQLLLKVQRLGGVIFLAIT